MRHDKPTLFGGLIALAAAATGVVAGAGPRGDLQSCTAPRFHDGDALACGPGRSMRLYAIDAPET